MKSRLLIITGIIAILIISIGFMLWPEYGMVCNNVVVEHLQKYSNLFYNQTNSETFGMNEIGYSFGVHSYNIKQCVDFVLENRALGK